MVKSLVLIRHAKSSWSDPKLRDYDRPLNGRGKKDAPKMGERLAKYHIVPDQIISSPANRALRTAKFIAEAVHYPISKIQMADEIYHGSSTDLMDVVNQIDDNNDLVFLFGHNPGFTTFANTLSGSYVDNIPTCGVFWIDFELDSWKAVSRNSGTMRLFDFPKNPNPPKYR